MLKTNSKKAKENLKNYILYYSKSAFDDEKKFYQYKFNYTEVIKDSFPDRCTWIYEKFKTEKKGELKNYNDNEFYCFQSWAAGLACNELFLYYYTRSAKNDLAIILEENDSEKNKYSEDQAEKLLTQLIYRELKNNMNK